MVALSAASAATGWQFFFMLYHHFFLVVFACCAFDLQGENFSVFMRDKKDRARLRRGEGKMRVGTREEPRSARSERAPSQSYHFQSPDQLQKFAEISHHGIMVSVFA